MSPNRIKPVATYTSYEVTDDPYVMGKIVYDASVLAAKDPGLPDGMAVDKNGNLWATGPGGVLVISPDGKLWGESLPGPPLPIAPLAKTVRHCS